MSKLRIIWTLALLTVGAPMAAFGQTTQPIIPLVSCNQPQYQFGNSTLAGAGAIGAQTISVDTAVPANAGIVINPGAANEEIVPGIGNVTGTGPFTLELKAGTFGTIFSYTSSNAPFYSLKKAHFSNEPIRFEFTQYTVSFGYNNPNATTVNIPRGVSSHNFFSPGPLVYSQQVTQFLPGIHNNAFSIIIPSQLMVTTWFLNDGEVRSSDSGSYCGTPFTYQGRLSNAGMPSTAQYDFQFTLFDALTDGTELGGVDQSALQVTSGLFTTQLDFGSTVTKNSTTFLQSGVRATGDSGPYTTLNPRQQLTSTPYAIRALRAASADTLDGTPAIDFVKTTDSRLTDARAPAAGNGSYIQNSTTPQANSNFNISGNGTIGGNLTVTGTLTTTLSGYIQNSTTQQSNSNFNISGDGVVGGTLTANAVKAATQFNIGIDRILSIGTANLFNTFVGLNAGNANPSGASNSFFGAGAGQATSTGGNNSAFGYSAGISNTTGSSNSFFGIAAGLFNVDGSANAFFGQNAGRNNLSGTNNVFVGVNAGLNTTTESNNTFIGAGAFGVAGVSNATAIGVGARAATSNTMVLGQSNVTVQVPGNLTVTGALTGNLPTGSGNYVQNTTTQQASSNFNVSGNGTVGGTLSANAVTAATQYNIGADRVLSTTAGSNVYVGIGAGQSDTTGNLNSFFGTTAGLNNTTGGANLFVGFDSGLSNTTESNNTFIGALANGVAGIHNATALGVNAQVNTSDSLVLGSVAGINGASHTTRVGIGTTSPNFALHLRADGQDGIKIQHSGALTLPQIRWTDVNDVFKGAVVVDTSATPRMLLNVNSINALVIDGSGNVAVAGTLSKGAGSFKIDHPLDPANKYLYHSFVESPDMMNIYNGLVTLDRRGQAVVTMPDWFEALNQDFRYQLTSIGAPGPNLYVAKKINNNTFKIAGGKPGSEVSWQITGIRHDAYAEAHRIPVEQVKPTQEQGTYLHPELFQEKGAGDQRSGVRVRKSKHVTNR